MGQCAALRLPQIGNDRPRRANGKRQSLAAERLQRANLEMLQQARPCCFQPESAWVISGNDGFQPPVQARQARQAFGQSLWLVVAIAVERIGGWTPSRAMQRQVARAYRYLDYHLRRLHARQLLSERGLWLRRRKLRARKFARGNIGIGNAHGIAPKDRRSQEV